MTGIFLKVVNMGIAAGWLVLAVITLRLVFRRAPKWMMPVLWGIAALRMVLPVSIQSVFSLIPSAETINPQIVYMQEPLIHSGIDSLNAAVNPVIVEAFAPDPAASVNPMQIVVAVAAACWIVGAVLMLGYMTVSYLRLKSRVRTAVRCADNIFQSEYVPSPFVLGIVHPRIYLPFGMEGAERAYVIAHEQAHLKRRDHWWKPIGYLLLSLHWYNPAVWAAYALFCRDLELACDERVVRDLSAGQRADYSQALLACSVCRRLSACPLAFGETGVAERVRNVLQYKKPALWLIAAAVVSCAVVAVCFLTNPKEPAADDSRQDLSPVLTVNEVRYAAPNMPAAQLPYGYTCAGTLDSAQAADTGTEGCAYYTSPYNPDCIYVYQESGTPIDPHTLDTTRRQWAYQQWIREGSGDGENRLTLEEVQRLAAFGEALTWEDFERYPYVETGSGLYIQVYEIDELFSVWIGGVRLTDTPLYIYLCAGRDPQEQVEIRTQDVSAFLDAHLRAG